MTTLQAIILAAGEGTRMKSSLPKVLHPICGRPMIAYALDLAASAGVKQPIVVIGHGADAVKTVLPKEAKPVMQTKALGTGDAVYSAKRSFKGTEGHVLILYADTPLLRRTTVQKLIESHVKTNATCTLLAAHLADPTGYGRIVRNEQGQVVGIVEEAEANASQRAIREINVGPIVCRVAALLEALEQLRPASVTKELYLTQVISHIARQEGTKIQVGKVQEVNEVMGINSKVELAKASGIIRHRIIDAHLRSGVTIVDPHTTYIDHGVAIGQDTVVQPCTVIETGVTIGKRCSIGPFARLRSGAHVGDDARVGNFVELVRTTVGSRVRINHVTYLGDAHVEDDVNIGAGTITANYDGKDKHPTHIGKGAFIGSDTVLIAPVKVGPGAITGAGSVVTRSHDVPPRRLVVGVPARLVNGERSEQGERSELGQRTERVKPSRTPPRPAAASKRVARKAAAKPRRRAVAAKRSRR